MQAPSHPELADGSVTVPYPDRVRVRIGDNAGTTVPKTGVERAPLNFSRCRSEGRCGLTKPPRMSTHTGVCAAPWGVPWVAETYSKRFQWRCPERVRSQRMLRSQRWYAGDGLRAFSHRTRTRQLGIGGPEHLGKPVIAIANSWTELNPCHSHLRERAEAVKRGVWQAGGYPVELPAGSMGGETFQKPTAMLYRNLLAMETEELLRSYPVDGAVLMGGCDKTTPALLMGAASMDLPAIFVPAGPMLRGNWRGEVLGSGSDMWRYWDDRRAGLVDDRHWSELEEGLARSPGHCMTMGTASTMTSVAEVLGLTLPGAASIPAPDSAHSRMAAASGMRIVEMVREDLRPSLLLDDRSYRDAITTVLALGGSTNAVIHLVAMANRSGVKITADDFD